MLTHNAVMWQDMAAAAALDVVQGGGNVAVAAKIPGRSGQQCSMRPHRMAGRRQCVTNTSATLAQLMPFQGLGTRQCKAQTPRSTFQRAVSLPLCTDKRIIGIQGIHSLHDLTQAQPAVSLSVRICRAMRRQKVSEEQTPAVVQSAENTEPPHAHGCAPKLCNRRYARIPNIVTVAGGPLHEVSRVALARPLFV